MLLAEGLKGLSTPTLPIKWMHKSLGTVTIMKYQKKNAYFEHSDSKKSHEFKGKQTLQKLFLFQLSVLRSFVIVLSYCMLCY